MLYFITLLLMVTLAMTVFSGYRTLDCFIAGRMQRWLSRQAVYGWAASTGAHLSMCLFLVIDLWRL